MFLRNVGIHLQDLTMSEPRTAQSEAVSELASSFIASSSVCVILYKLLCLLISRSVFVYLNRFFRTHNFTRMDYNFIAPIIRLCSILIRFSVVFSLVVGFTPNDVE
jgi:hypothetical protein